MDRNAIVKDAIGAFAAQLKLQRGASRLLLFGSQARGDARSDSDFDFIVVSEQFRDVHPFERHFGMRQIWYAVGGDAPMDLICLTPEEFERASHSIMLVQAVLPEAIDLLPVAVPA